MVTYPYAYMTYIVSPLAGLCGDISWRPPAYSLFIQCFELTLMLGDRNGVCHVQNLALGILEVLCWEIRGGTCSRGMMSGKTDRLNENPNRKLQ